jgi:hypothetical protein
VNIDLQRIGVTQRTAEQRSQCGMFLYGEIAETKAFNLGAD